MAPHWKCGSGQPVAGSNPALSANLGWIVQRLTSPPIAKVPRDPTRT